MIGTSSAAQHSDILAGLLALIRSPEAMAKNIEVLQAKILASENSVRLAREEQAKAKEAVVLISKREVDITRREEAVVNQELALQNMKLALDSYKSDLDVVANDLRNREEGHGDNIKSLDDALTKHRVAQAAFDKRSGTLKKEHDDRMEKLDIREKVLASREDAIAAKEADIKGKFDKIKEIAG